MSSPKAVQNESVAGELVFAETVKFGVFANIWSHERNWGGSVTFNAFVAVEPGDRATLRIHRRGEFSIEIVSVVRHEGGETTVTFDGAGLVPASGSNAAAAGGSRTAS